MARKKEKPLCRMLDSRNFMDGSLEFLVGGQSEKAVETLQPHYETIRAQIEKYGLENFDEALIGNFDSWIDMSCNRLFGEITDKRLAYSLFRSIAMEDEKAKKQAYGSRRFPVSLVPKPYVVRSWTSLDPDNFDSADAKKFFEDSDNFGMPQDIGSGVRYLRQCVGANCMRDEDPSVADVYATYLCGLDDVLNAKNSVGGSNYFPRVTETGAVIPGYRDNLDPIKRRLVDRALSFWYITDYEGKTHPELLDANNMPSKGLDAK